MIRVAFTDFWPGFEPKDSWFFKVFSEKYPATIVTEKPDVTFHSCFGTQFRKHDSVRIYYTGENISGNLRNSDFLIGFDREESERKIRYPLYLLYSGFEKIAQRPLPNTNRNFCSFVSSNPWAFERNFMFNLLSQIGPVHSGGRVLNNVGGPVNDKRTFISSYLFNLSFENESSVGYCTEKIVDAFVCNTIPIYWGDPTVVEEFNPKSFINVHQFRSFSDAARHIKRVYSSPTALSDYLSALPMQDPAAFKAIHDQKLLQIFGSALDLVSKNKTNHRLFRNIARPAPYRRLSKWTPIRWILFQWRRSPWMLLIYKILGKQPLYK